MGSSSLGQCLGEAFRGQGGKTALTFSREGRSEAEVTYEALDRETRGMASHLLDRGVRKGDRVILFCPKSLAFVFTHLALQYIGAVSVPLNPGFKKSEMAYFLDDAQPALVVCSPSTAAHIQAIDPQCPVLTLDTDKPYRELSVFGSNAGGDLPADVDSDDPALIIYTSGTTGKPKGAVLTQRNLVHDARNIVRFWAITEADVLCHALPLFHVHGLCFALHTAFVAGAHTLLLDRFDPKTVLGVLLNRETHPVCTVFMAVPSMYARLLETLGDRRLDCSHMRLWTSGSAPLLTRDFHRIREAFGKEPVEREGMSETGMNFSNPLDGVRKPGSVGVPLPGLEVRVVDPESLRDVPRGETGEFWLRGSGITPGYWKKPEETAKTLCEGWFRTGDLGRVDEDGYYFLTDRIKHMIISGGENISPKEIEAVINRMEGVAESSVVGLADERWGEVVAAAVVPLPGAEVTEEAVRAVCREHLHDWKCPKRVLFLDALPKNTMGKVLKDEVRAAFGP